MKNLRYSFILLFLFLSAEISKAGAMDTTGVFLTLENEVTYIFGKAEMTAQSLTYHNEKGKEHTVSLGKLKYMIVGNRVWCGFPLKKGDRRYSLQEIIAMNKNYILMSFWGGAFSYLYIYDYESNLVEIRIKTTNETGTGSKKNDREAYEIVSPYFKLCPDLLSRLKQNVDKEKPLTDGISAVLCEGAPSIQKFLATYKDKRMGSEK